MHEVEEKRGNSGFVGMRGRRAGFSYDANVSRVIFLAKLKLFYFNLGLWEVYTVHSAVLYYVLR